MSREGDCWDNPVVVNFFKNTQIKTIILFTFCYLKSRALANTINVIENPADQNKNNNFHCAVFFNVP